MVDDCQWDTLARLATPLATSQMCACLKFALLGRFCSGIPIAVLWFTMKTKNKQRDFELTAIMWLNLAIRCDERSPVGQRELALALASAHMDAADRAYIDAYCAEVVRS